jgi:hypothetical protein
MPLQCSSESFTLGGVGNFFIGLDSPEEVVVAWRAVESYRRSRISSAQATPTASEGDLAPDVGELAERIRRGFMWRPLGAPYEGIFRELLKVPEGQAITIEDLSSKLGASFDEVKARLAKLSGRLKRIATPDEIASLRTPFMLFAAIESAGGATRYRLTPAGREATRRYLGL